MSKKPLQEITFILIGRALTICAFFLQPHSGAFPKNQLDKLDQNNLLPDWILYIVPIGIPDTARVREILTRAHARDQLLFITFHFLIHSKVPILFIASSFLSGGRWVCLGSHHAANFACNSFLFLTSNQVQN